MNTEIKQTKQFSFYSKEEESKILQTNGKLREIEILSQELKRSPNTLRQKYYTLTKKAGSTKVKTNTSKIQEPNGEGPLLNLDKAERELRAASLREFKALETRPVQINGMNVRFPNNEFTIHTKNSDGSVQKIKISY